MKVSGDVWRQVRVSADESAVDKDKMKVSGDVWRQAAPTSVIKAK